MITATIGKIFLDAYNKKNHTDYDAKSFFVEVYHPLFFGSSKYLQWVQNSPFVQGLESSNSGEFGVAEVIKDANGITKHFKKKEDLSSFLQSEYKDSMDEILEIKDSKLEQIKILWKITTRQTERMLNTFLKKVEDKDKPDASIASGFPASEDEGFATTSGQVTNMDLKVEKDDIFLSWIGSSLGIGFGVLSILFTEPEILMDLFEGWKLYRSVLNNNDKLRGNQINTWNGQWLSHYYDKRSFHSEEPMAEFNPFETNKNGMSVATQSWTKVVIGISQKYNNPKMMGYVYGLGKTNTTIGFIPFHLEHIRKPIQLYQRLFGSDEGRKAEGLWGTEKAFKVCCQKGVIGIEAMQPKGLKPYMKPDNGKDVRIPKYDDKQLINYHTYQIWLLAMLNNEELWNKSIEFAKTLQAYVNKDKKLSTKRGNLVKNILASSSKKTVLSALSEIASDVESFSKIEENAKIIHLMPTDNVPYYLTLIRFHYAGLSNKSNQKSLQLEFQ